MVLNELKLANDELQKCLTSLLQVVTEKQKAIIGYNYEQLSKAIEKEESRLFELQKIHKMRRSILSKLKSELSLDVNESNFEDLLEVIQDKINKETWLELYNSSDEIRKRIKEIQLVNDQNKYLADYGRSFIRELISNLVGAEKKSIIDRKI
ncbi:flagellar export chaperone FlgN [Melioribacteraceae bacterium 4301-Me]|uniref:flagellar export chaperone FlgN n=1 Tax=Pyranulibacter aquaticus TaxID=3163344 RepID=UPI0035980C15